MPLGRNARQRRGRSAPRDPNKFTPRVDVFGTLRLPSGGDVRGRLIEYAPDTFAFFTADAPEDPVLFETSGEFVMKGRTLTAQSEYGEIKFQKAGCGCETPHNLRGARSPLLAHVPGAEPIPEPTPDELIDEVLHISSP